jgi:hypothetical protein
MTGPQRAMSGALSGPVRGVGGGVSGAGRGVGGSRGRAVVSARGGGSGCGAAEVAA